VKSLWLTRPAAPHVTPQDQADYLVGAFRRVRREWPWVGMLAVWNLSYGALEGGDPLRAEMAGFSLVMPDLRPRQAYYALQALQKGP